MSNGHVEKTVFLSYRRTNFPWALAVFQDLTQYGYDVFIDFDGIASGNFERVILENITARAHFLVLLTPSALEHCGDPADWLRREIETAIVNRRNIVPLMFDGFSFNTPEITGQLTGKLAELKHYNGITVPPQFFKEAMDKLRQRYLNVELTAVLHPASPSAQRAATQQQAAADAAPAVLQDELTAQQLFERGFAATEPDEKIRFFTKAVLLQPDFFEAFYHRAMARADQGDLEGASEDLDEVVRIKPDHAPMFQKYLAMTKRTQMATPYMNTIPAHEEISYPGDRQLERRIKSLIRWNAMAMVHQQNKKDPGIGGHISTYSSIATLLEVGFNHFFRAEYGGEPGDFVYFQGHSSPGIYARAFLEGRISEEQVNNFRHELRNEPGLSSYPHPRLMPNFWEFPTVSLGIGPINAIHQARFMRYLEDRQIIAKTNRKIWVFIGDGETDEPETLGSLRLASREHLDNLVFVVSCNLQRLDGPVRGNGKIINELEASFRAAGWNVIKVIWGSDWDKLFARERVGILLKRMDEAVDGEYQSYKARGGAYIRREFFAKYPELLDIVSDLTDDELHYLKRGGHDPQKVYNAYKRAIEHPDGPTVILAHTAKGYGLGSAEARNATHTEKKLADQALSAFRTRFDIPIPESASRAGTLYRPAEDSPEIRYLQLRRKELGGYMPFKDFRPPTLSAPDLEYFTESIAGSKGRAVSTTMGFVSMLRLLLKNSEIGRLIVPIIPDESRTFGLESIIRQVGIYASQGQIYKPHDQDMLLYYREEKSGQVIEEGITEAGAMASFTAAGTAYSNYRVPMIPFLILYSMFGFQRLGDLIWAFADSCGKGFLVGGCAGRTTLAGEGLQHQDGHSPLLASTLPTCSTYDPAYVYEIAVIVQDGIRRMFQEGEDRFYYITLYNEDYAMPEKIAGCEEGIIRGIYKLKQAPRGNAIVQLFGSGPILNEALRAQNILADNYNVQADVWSVTSYGELRREALATQRWSRLHPTANQRRPYILSAIDGSQGPIIAATDYMKAIPDQIAPWLGSRLETLGTDGFGRSDSRQQLRRHFEVSAESICAAALCRLARDGILDAQIAQNAFVELGLDPEKVDPAHM